MGPSARCVSHVFLVCFSCVSRVFVVCLSMQQPEDCEVFGRTPGGRKLHEVRHERSGSGGTLGRCQGGRAPHIGRGEGRGGVGGGENAIAGGGGGRSACREPPKRVHKCPRTIGVAPTSERLCLCDVFVPPWAWHVFLDNCVERGMRDVYGWTESLCFGLTSRR